MSAKREAPNWNPKFDIVFEKYDEMKKEASGKLQKYNNS